MSNSNQNAFGRNRDGRLSVFDIQGISKTKLTLNVLDSSVDAKTASIKDGSVLSLPTDIMAIEKLLGASGVFCNKTILPTTDKRSLFEPGASEDGKLL